MRKSLVAMLCLAAAVRVFLCAAAFPFFNNMDEQAHVDLVLKYARGYWPNRSSEPFDRSAAALFVKYGTLEYVNPVSRFAGGVAPPPLWTQTPETIDRTLANGLARWETRTNHEAHSAPAYYVVAGLWWRFGKALGLSEPRLLYWLRFLDVTFAVLLVWASWAYCREAHPERPDLHLAVPLLAAFVPLDAMYAVNDDALGPLLGALSLLATLKWYRTKSPRILSSVATALLASSTVLLKYTDAAVACVFIGLSLRKAWRAVREQRGADVLAPLVGAGAPVVVIGAYLARNYLAFGDLTGMNDKVQVLGWTRQPFVAMLHHPIFTPAGFAAFWTRLMQTLWRGELRWHLEPIADARADVFYVASSSILLLIAAFAAVRAAWRGRTVRGFAHPTTTTLDWGVVVLSVACLVVLSASFDYGNCFYPSRDFPYLASGRLIGAALIPFLVVYVDGASQALRLVTRSHVAATIGFAAATCAVIAASETILTRPFFSNEYNWFHLPDPTSYISTLHVDSGE